MSRTNDLAGILLLTGALALAAWCWMQADSPPAGESPANGTPPDPDRGDASAGGETPLPTEPR